jgi:hypothetical protein
VTVPHRARRRPEGRYDPPSRTPARLLAVLLSVLLIALVAAVAALLWDRYDADDVTARVIRFSVESDREVRIDLEVTKPAGSPAYCLVRSRGLDGAEVGRDVAVVDAIGSAQERVRYEHVLSTSRRGVTGEVGRCSAVPPPAPGVAP